MKRHFNWYHRNHKRSSKTAMKNYMLALGDLVKCIYNLTDTESWTNENMNRPITSKATESVIKYLLRKNMCRTRCFTAELYQTFKEEIIYKTFSNSSKEVNREVIAKTYFINSVYSDTEARQRHYKKREYMSVSFMNISAALPQQNTIRSNSRAH